jgi:hypothetical protein
MYEAIIELQSCRQPRTLRRGAVPVVHNPLPGRPVLHLILPHSFLIMKFNPVLYFQNRQSLAAGSGADAFAATFLPFEDGFLKNAGARW